MSTSCCDQTDFGLVPTNIKWSIVRGDTAELTIEFLENDETTTVDMSDWTFLASAYDPKADTIDELQITANETNLVVTAPADITQYWGVGYSSMVAELTFDVQAVNNITKKVWTPVVGIIKVLGDVTGGSL
jgi:aryl-phospho-beta-D-glucosidase BglC (GH1 family)